MFSFEDKAKEKDYQKAEEKLREAGLDIFEVDRKQITVLKNEQVRIYLVPWSRHSATRDELGRLKSIESFVIVRDRYQKAKKGKVVPQTELGYFLMDLEDEDK